MTDSKIMILPNNSGHLIKCETILKSRGEYEKEIQLPSQTASRVQT